MIKASLDRARKSNLVDSVKHISKGGLLVECHSRETSDDIINTINNSLKNEFVASKPKKKKPQIILMGVDGEVSKESLITEIIESNREIKAFIESRPNSEKIEDNISIRFKFRRMIVETQATEEPQRRVEKTDKYVLEVSPQLRKVIFCLRSIKIGWRSHKYAEYLPIIRCHKCNNFGHFQTECKASQACGHCGQQHNSRECKTEKKDYKCVNCCRFNDNNKSGKRVSVNHSSHSESCGAYKRIESLIINKTDYGL